jgi:hypothetical protein
VNNSCGALPQRRLQVVVRRDVAIHAAGHRRLKPISA